MISIVVAAILAAFGFYSALEHQTFASEQIRLLTRAVTTNVSASVADDIIGERRDNIEALLLRLSGIGDIRELAVADAGGNVLSRVLRPHRAEARPDFSAAGRVVVARSPLSSETKREYRYTIPIVRGEVIGSVTAVSGFESALPARDRIFEDTIWAVWVTIAVCILVLGLTLRSTIKSLVRTARFASLITADQGAQLEIETDVSEIRDLVVALNEMSATLASQYNALSESRAREIETGGLIHRTLLLGDVPVGVRGAWIATRSEPSQGIDGDFFAIHRHSDSCFELLVGDVMGKGVPAALIGAGVKNTYSRVLAELLAAGLGARTLPAVSTIVNAMHAALTPRLISLDAFVTLALYRFDLEAGTLSYVSAGHTDGLLFRGASCVAQAVRGENMPLGVHVDECYVDACLPIGPSDALLAYSDGITEARSADGAQEYGFERLRLLLEQALAAGLPPSAALQGLKQDLIRFSGPRPTTDDQTSVLVQLQPVAELEAGRGGAPATPEVFDVPWNVDSIGEIRARIEAFAAALPERSRNEIVLAAVEAASNILRHAETGMTDCSLACRMAINEESMTVELFHPGRPFEPMAAESDFTGNSEGGFGLYIIQKSADEVRYEVPLPGICVVRLTKLRGPTGG